MVRHQGAAASPRTLHATSEAASSAGGVVVWGELTAGTLGTAVLGSAATTDGVGVQADSLGTGLLITDHSVTMPPTSGNWTRGSFVVSGGHVWYCYATGFGAASLWARLSSTFVPLATPVRIYNSIGGDGPLGNGQERSVGVTNGTTIPHTVSAVLTNLACNNPSAAGFLAMFKSGTTWPGTSNLNFQAHQNISNSVTSTVTSVETDYLTVNVRAGGAASNVVIDVFGWYQP